MKNSFGLLNYDADKIFSRDENADDMSIHVSQIYFVGYDIRVRVSFRIFSLFLIFHLT